MRPTPLTLPPPWAQWQPQSHFEATLGLWGTLALTERPLKGLMLPQSASSQFSRLFPFRSAITPESNGNGQRRSNNRQTQSALGLLR